MQCLCMYFTQGRAAETGCGGRLRRDAGGGAAITAGVVRNKGDVVDAAAQGGALSSRSPARRTWRRSCRYVEVDPPTTAEVSTVTVRRVSGTITSALNEVIKESELDLPRQK